MIAIADSGSTKTDWVILDDNLNEVLRTSTIGFNPYFVTADDISSELEKNEDLNPIASEFKKVFFYGAGTSSEKLKEVVYNGLHNFFTNAELVVDHDLLAACYASYMGKPAMVCILGTGSNSCYFDGVSLREETKSLAYILGDEGSGNDLGKRLLRAYFTKKMPPHLSKAFDDYYKLTVEELNHNVYNNKFANTYLASFNKFVLEHRNDPFVQKIIYDAMSSFIEYQILPYEEARQSELNFIGSIAYIYEDIIRSVAAQYHLNVGHIIRKPIDNIVDYHKKYLINN
ncbi:ATPase [Chishuiella sp.]|uniref:ATPase n=1 Tax=Chishuiella sp. TaxID=1969467 RepID=UPI0028A9B71D|nr:ATPase [Chishuiella sp.]